MLFARIILEQVVQCEADQSPTASGIIILTGVDNANYGI